MSVGVRASSTFREFLEVVGQWARSARVDTARLPAPSTLRELFSSRPIPCRPPASAQAVDDWERRHGFALPNGLRAWLLLSDGFYLGAPAIHPLGAIGPMVPFAKVRGMAVQPESWFEVGNPTESETVCADLAYRWPDGDHPLFTSGDDHHRIDPRLIAPSFEDWFLRLLQEGGRPFWLEPTYPNLGDPWAEHCRHTPAPPISADLLRLIDLALPLVDAGVDERSIAERLGICRADAESMVRHLQHRMAGPRLSPFLDRSNDSPRSD